jgi:glycosyltransferase involved in cell wall biosynthesis
VRILFLLSCLEPAGSETYCTALAEAWRGKHEIFWISDQLHNDQPYISMPIHGKAIPFGLINTWRVASYIRKNHIKLVHSHSRRAHWVAAQAARLTGIAHVTTVHQPLPVHFFSRLFPCLGHQTIAIDEVVYDHLRTLFAQPADQVQLVRNGINLTNNLPSVRQSPKVKQILIVGRLSGGRWRAFQFILENLNRLAPTLPPANYKIVGQIPNERRAGLVDQLSILGSHLAPATIEMMGFVKDLPNLIRNSDAAIAAGRSALECLAQGRPVLLLGEGGVLGFCRPEIWPQALQTNFGDHLEPKTFAALRFETGLRELLTPRTNLNEISHWGRAQMEKYFDIRQVASQVESVYECALTRAHKKAPSR